MLPSIKRIFWNNVIKKSNNVDLQLRNNSYSSLYVSSKYGQEIFRVIQPSYDSKYLNFIAENIETIEKLFKKRSIYCHDYCYDKIQQLLKDFIQCLKKTESLKKKRNQLGKIKNNDYTYKKYQQIQSDLVKSRKNLYELEEKLIPFLLSIPNDVEPGIVDEYKILDRWQEKSAFQQKSNSYVRLGYINNLYHRSIVGPKANYLQGQGAILYYGLVDMISDLFDQSGYIQIDGLDLVKSAIVEAVNFKQFSNDPYMIRLSNGQSKENQRLHLVGDSSLESLCAFIVRNKIQRGKFYQIGSSFELKSIEHKHTIKATILTDSMESSLVMKDLYKIFWDLLTKIGVDRCSLRTDIRSLYVNEYDKYVLMAWLKSRQEWLQIGQISNHHHYISQRLGLPKYQNCHLIDSSIDLIPLIFTILEQFQIFETGKIKIPSEISKHFII